MPDAFGYLLRFKLCRHNWLGPKRKFTISGMKLKAKSIKGQVLGFVPGISEWYNVQFNEENEILSLV